MMRKTTAMKTRTRTAAKTATWEKRAGDRCDRVSIHLQYSVTVRCYSRTEAHTGVLYSQVSGSPSCGVCRFAADRRQRRETLQS